MAGNAIEIAGRYRRYLQQIAIALHDLESPLIAAVNGPAMGAGLDIACMCDIRLASERARFAETFISLVPCLVVTFAWGYGGIGPPQPCRPNRMGRPD